MHLILTSDGDPDAVWLARELGQAGLDCLAVTAGALAAASDWRHFVSTKDAWFTVRLPDGQTLDSRSVRGTINRLQAVLPRHIAAAGEEERGYGEQEFAALMLSVLACLPAPLLNPPTPQGLCGAVKHPSELAWLAAQAGLPTLPYVFETAAWGDSTAGWAPLAPPGTPVATVYVVGNQVVGPATPGHRHGCQRLAAALGDPLVGIDFLATPDRRTVFAGASPSPRLAPGGAALVAALARALHGGAEDGA